MPRGRPPLCRELRPARPAQVERLERLPLGADGREHVDDDCALGARDRHVRRVRRNDVGRARAELTALVADPELERPVQDEPELLVVVAVFGGDRAWVELHDGERQPLPVDGAGRNRFPHLAGSDRVDVVEGAHGGEGYALLRQNRRVAVYVALLRGVNLGARNKVSMRELEALLGSLGFEDVVTYVQSGNVVFSSQLGTPDEISATIERAIAKDLGVETTAVLRSAAELRQVTDRNPFVADESDLTKLLVVFLDRVPADAERQLDPDRSRPDRFALDGQHIYLHVPNGFGRSKLTLDYFERRLGAKGTVRNWRTVTKLLALVNE